MNLHDICTFLLRYAVINNDPRYNFIKYSTLNLWIKTVFSEICVKIKSFQRIIKNYSLYFLDQIYMEISNFRNDQGIC